MSGFGVEATRWFGLLGHVKRFAAILLGCAAYLSGCQSTPLGVYGGSISRSVPLVTLTAVHELEGTTANGYPWGTFPAPAYPTLMRRVGVRGAVLVRIQVGIDGRVKDAFVLRSSQPEFIEPTLAAVRHWRFAEFLAPGEKVRRGFVADCEIDFAFEDE